MKRLIAEWLWRAAVICALTWIGWELHQVHEDMLQPADDEGTLTASSDEVQQGIDDVRGDVAELADKVDALIVAMAHSRELR